MSETEPDKAVTEVSRAAEDSLAKSAPDDRRTAGPFDISEANEVRPYLDLGAIKVIPREGLRLRLDVEDQTKRIVAVSFDYAESTLQVQAFAAPRSTGLWNEYREQTATQLRGQGATITETTGVLGSEVRAQVPLAAKDGAPAGVRHVLFVGVDGPRWFLRGVIAGKAVEDKLAAAQVADLFRSLVIVRGDNPMPPRDLLPLKVPAGATAPGNQPSGPATV